MKQRKILNAIIISYQVKRARLDNFIPCAWIVISSCNGPGFIKAVDDRGQLRGNAQGTGIALLRYLVANAPDHYAGVVAVA